MQIAEERKAHKFNSCQNQINKNHTFELTKIFKNSAVSPPNDCVSNVFIIQIFVFFGSLKEFLIFLFFFHFYSLFN